MEGKKEPREEVSSATSAAQGALAGTAEAVQQAAGHALSQASGVADDVLAPGRHAAQTASRQVNEQPLMVVIAGFALGYVAAFLLHGRR
jgi:type VI protein secretion system component VasF